jgi:hypothetical protein
VGQDTLAVEQIIPGMNLKKISALIAGWDKLNLSQIRAKHVDNTHDQWKFERCA